MRTLRMRTLRFTLDRKPQHYSNIIVVRGVQVVACRRVEKGHALGYIDVDEPISMCKTPMHQLCSAHHTATEAITARAACWLLAVDGARHTEPR